MVLSQKPQKNYVGTRKNNKRILKIGKRGLNNSIKDLHDP